MADDNPTSIIKLSPKDATHRFQLGPMIRPDLRMSLLKRYDRPRACETHLSGRSTRRCNGNSPVSPCQLSCFFVFLANKEELYVDDSFRQTIPSQSWVLLHQRSVHYAILETYVAISDVIASATLSSICPVLPPSDNVDG